MRTPSDNIAIDANILVSMVLSRAEPSKRMREFVRVATSVALVTSERAVHEVRMRVHSLRPEALPIAERALTAVKIFPDNNIPSLVMREAAGFLQRAPQSGNGSIRDDHLLSVASVVGADIWSHDKDFFGTGVAVWSTGNLMVALGLQGHSH